MNPNPYNGEGAIISQDPNDIWHIHNRSGCIAHTNHPLAALDFMKQFNWSMIACYYWGTNQGGSLLPIMEPTKINGAVIAEAVNNAKFAWLN